MNRKHTANHFTSLLRLALVTLSLPCAAYAQQATMNAPQTTEARAETHLLKALLDEVRALRLAVQSSSLSQHRAQILLERIGRQQDRIEGLSADLEQLRAEMQELANPARYDDELREMETAISATSDPQARAAQIQAYEALKHSLARQRQADQQELQRQQERERVLDAKLRMEQARLAEMQEQLEAVERELDRQVAEARQRR
jgi:predicted  nucleic acid-binding Zn-ribbon protein